jgi:hypothetical protein
MQNKQNNNKENNKYNPNNQNNLNCQDSRDNNDKKSNHKILIIFISILAVSAVGGYIAGRVVARAERNVSLVNLACEVKEFLVGATPFVFIVVSILGIIISLVSFMRCQVMYKKLQNDKENDDLWDALEEKLNQPMILSSAFCLVVLCLFLCCMVIACQEQYQPVLFIAISLSFVADYVVVIVIQKLIIDIEKELNPEKRGNVLDVNFQKVWMNSCDEAQKMIVYKAGYKAYLSTNVACLILVLVAFIYSSIVKTDLVALIFVCIILFVNNMSYLLRAARLEKRK